MEKERKQLDALIPVNRELQEYFEGKNTRIYSG